MTSKKSKFITTLAVAILALTFVQIITNSSSAKAAAPTQLEIYIGPTSVPADNKIYNIVAVQMQDNKGNPARASEDTTISLTSSQTNVGTVDSIITILKGSTQATANFYATYTPGTTAITASASGFMTVQATVKTVGPIPSAVAVYGSPSVLPADCLTHESIVVQLQDSSGTPAKAPNEGVSVILTSSNITVGSVPYMVFIPGGSTYTVAPFTTTISPGKADITPIASGYSSKIQTITTKALGTAPTRLQVYVAPVKVPADGEIYRQIVVQLEDQQNTITTTPFETIVTLSSSNTAVGIVEQMVIIPAFKTYGRANFATTFSSGTTTITAAASNCTSDEVTLTTVGPVPTKLAVYAIPSSLSADNNPTGAIQVQLQDASGKPAKDPNGDITVHLFSSTSETGMIDETLTIPYGQTFATGIFCSTFIPNSTTITAQASGYTTGQTKITTTIVDPIFINVFASADTTYFKAGEETTIRAYVTFNETSPATKATVTFISDRGGNFTSVTNEGNGYYIANFTAPKVNTQTTFTITANATKTGYTGTNTNVQLIIDPNPVLFPTPTPKITPSPTPTPTPTPKVTPTPTFIPTPTPTPTSAPTPTATVSPTPTPKGTATPSPKASPTPSTTIQPTPTPEPQQGAPLEIIISIIAAAAVTATLFAVPFTRHKIILLAKGRKRPKKQQ